ncbi:hypothetical protein JCM5350_004161 [Sporobolomyces pararoseus]
MAHRAQQPSTASSTLFVYSSFDPSTSSHDLQDESPRMINNDEYSSHSQSQSYAYDDRSARGLQGYGYDYDLEELSPPRREFLGDNNNQHQHERSTTRKDSIFSFTSNNRDLSGIHSGRDGGGETAFQGEEYRNDPFSTISNNIDRQAGRKKKRYGLSEEESTSFAEEEEDDSTEEDDDLEVYNNNSQIHHSSIGGGGNSSSPTLGNINRRRNRFEKLTIQELSWMGISTVLTLSLLSLAVVVTVVG